ncbi:hypothetical protein ACP70R_021324 [Stipagrostis hirtigluma subsp. patula]
MVVVDALRDDAAAIADELFGSGGDDLQAFFDHAELEVKAGVGGGGGEEDEEEELEWLSNKDAFPTVDTMAPEASLPPKKRVRVEPPRAPPPPPPPPRAPAAKAAERRWRCRHCGTEETPQSREGPEGPGTLCNACGVRYRSGRLVPEYRPAKSPTFSSELHSNSHRRILQMRLLRLRDESAKASPAAAAGIDDGK